MAIPKLNLAVPTRRFVRILASTTERDSRQPVMRGST
jgi:hypothetical protein